MNDFDWADIRPGSTVVMPLATYSEFIGLRRTRSGLWTWRGKRWRTRALALRRCPDEVVAGRVKIQRDQHRIVAPGTALVLAPIDPQLVWCSEGYAPARHGLAVLGVAP